MDQAALKYSPERALLSKIEGRISSIPSMMREYMTSRRLNRHPRLISIGPAWPEGFCCSRIEPLIVDIWKVGRVELSQAQALIASERLYELSKCNYTAFLGTRDQRSRIGRAVLVRER